MNNFIALAIVLPILLFFTAQYTLQLEHQHNMAALETIVESAKEEARQEGYFTPEIIARIRADITAEFRDVSSGEILIDVTTTPKYRTDSYDRRELIEYSIGVPMKKLSAANHLFGISDADNTTIIYIKGSVASEKLL
jgi:hypothetical protein